MSPRPAIDHIRKPQILAAAAEVITERGLAATRIADVAERAGTSAPAVLYWFDSREQLLNEALIADEERFAARARPSGSSQLDSARERLRVADRGDRRRRRPQPLDRALGPLAARRGRGGARGAGSTTPGAS